MYNPSQFLILKMRKYNHDLTDSQANIAQFGLECLINEASKIIIYFIIFALFSKADLFLISLIPFTLFRVFAGGFHNNTYVRCLITSFSIFAVNIFVSSMFSFRWEIRLVQILVSIILTFYFAPVDHPNKPIISTKRRKMLKTISLIVLFAVSSISFILTPIYSASVVNSVFIAATMLPLGYILNKNANDKYLSGDD